MKAMWILNRTEMTIALTDVPRDLIADLQMVRVLSEGEWLVAYEWAV